MDLIARVERLPNAGETILGTSLTALPGGKGANQAVAAARAGSEVAFVGRVGNDAYATQLLDSLRSAGVSTSHTIVEGRAPTGLAMIEVDAVGENTIVVIPGANSHLTPADVERARSTIASSHVLLLQLEIPHDAVLRAAQIGHEAGTLVMLNPAPARPLDPSLLGIIDVVVPNEDEVARLTGLGAPVDAAATSYLVLDMGAKAVVVTLGPRGAVIVTREKEIDIPAIPVQPVDSTGAGDAFVGNLARALDAGESLEHAARFASAAAALSVTREGAQPSMPAEAETRALLQGETQVW
jgi:ribokinase